MGSDSKNNQYENKKDLKISTSTPKQVEKAP